MIRSICLISREYPPESSFGGIARVAEVQARTLARLGVAVHVISLDPTGSNRTVLQDGVVVHRIPQMSGIPSGLPYVERGLWARVVADHFARMDDVVGFDAVWAADYFGETFHLTLRPETALITFLHTTHAVAHPDSREDPVDELANQLELKAIGRADAVVALSRFVKDETERAAGTLPPTHEIAPPVELDRFPTACLRPAGEERLELLFVGRIERLKRPELALHTLAEVKRRGVRARLTLVGRDTPDGPLGTSYRRGVLLPLVDRLRLDFSEVRFVDQLDFDGVCQHLRHADVAVMPSIRENIHAAAIEALATGRPVICGGRTGLAQWLDESDGLARVYPDDPDAFAERAADLALDADWRASVLDAAPRAVARSFDPLDVVGRALELTADVVCSKRPADLGSLSPQIPARLGIVMLAHNAGQYTKRAVQSVLAHTRTAFQLVVVDNASTDDTGEWLETVTDDRVVVVGSGTNLGVSGGRNAGIEALDSGVELIAFLDNDVEVLAAWDVPFVEKLRRESNIGIAGEIGVDLEFNATGRREVPLVGQGDRPCHMVIGYCMVMRAEAVGQIGLFDENLGVFWHDDDEYAMRARRLGWGVHQVSSGRVIHFEHRSSETVDGIWKAKAVPAELSGANQRYLSEKADRFERSRSSGFVVVSDLDALERSPALLEEYGSVFTEEHPALLVIRAPSCESAVLEARLRTLASGVGVDVEHGPRMLALNADASPEADRELADTAFAVLASSRSAGPFAHLPHFGVGDADGLRRLALRVFAAQQAKGTAAKSGRVAATPSPALTGS